MDKQPAQEGGVQIDGYLMVLAMAMLEETRLLVAHLSKNRALVVLTDQVAAVAHRHSAVAMPQAGLGNPWCAMTRSKCLPALSVSSLVCAHDNPGKWRRQKA